MLKVGFSNRFFIASVFMIVLIKLYLVLILKAYDLNFFGGGGDADYYHSYAIGQHKLAVNVWPLTLKYLASFDLYSRVYISYVLVFISIFIIPSLVAYLSMVKFSAIKRKVFLIVFIIVSLYPNLFFLSLDIYRDIVMVFLFLIGVFVFRGLSIENKKKSHFFLFVFGVFMAILLYGFRPYLGFGYFFALLFSRFYSLKKYPFFTVILFIVFVLYVFFVVGVLDPILQYRSNFQNGLEGGSNIGIGFESNSTFVFDLIKSFIYQMMGLYFPNVVSLFAFLSESFIFIFLLVFLVKNRKFSNTFVDYLIVFFVSYSLIWIIGNDNLGTATRLRMFSYVSIYISAFVVYQNKFMFLRGDNRFSVFRH